MKAMRIGKRHRRGVLAGATELVGVLVKCRIEESSFGVVQVHDRASLACQLQRARLWPQTIASPVAAHEAWPDPDAHNGCRDATVIGGTITSAVRVSSWIALSRRWG